MMYEVKLTNNLPLNMTLRSDKGVDKKYIVFECKDDNNCFYEGTEKLKKFLRDTDDKQFFENKDKYKYELKIGGNDNEITLFISKNNIQKLSVSLKEKITNGKDNTIEKPSANNQKEKDNKGEAPPVNPENQKEKEKPTEIPTPIFESEKEIFKKIIDLKTKYDEAITKIKKDNEELVKDNEQLKKEIDEEKRRNDEIVKVFLENREKYELAVKKNSDITESQNQL